MIEKTGQLIAAFSFLAFVLNIPPSCYHIGKGNIPASSLILWLSYNNLTSFINALIWSGNDFYSSPNAPGYCDLTVRISTGSSTGKICCLACLIMNLYFIIDAKHNKFLDSGSKRRTYINLAICWLTPVCIMGTSLVVQSSRYVIVKYRGCVAPYSITYASVLLVTMWILIWSFVATVFATLTVWTYLRKRRDIKDILKCTNSGLNIRRFARLLIFSLLIMFVLCPFAIFNFVNDVREYGISSFSFSETHNELWNHIYKLEFGNYGLSSRIVDIVLSVITFMLFGMGTDAIEMYRKALIRIGFTSLRKTAPDVIAMSSEFKESRHSTRATQKTGQSEETANTTFEFSKYKGLFDPSASISLARTLSKSAVAYAETIVDPDDLDRCLGCTSESSLNLRFDFNVQRH